MVLNMAEETSVLQSQLDVERNIHKKGKCKKEFYLLHLLICTNNSLALTPRYTCIQMYYFSCKTVLG